MIAAYFKDRSNYDALLPQLKEIEALAKECKTKPVGRYETDWGFYLVQEGTTYPAQEGVFESHRKYLDVQCLVEGHEYMEWQDLDKLELETPYSEEKDVQFMRGTGNLMEIQEGRVYVMFPADGHKACCHIEIPTAYRKLVAKIRLF